MTERFEFKGHSIGAISNVHRLPDGRYWCLIDVLWAGQTESEKAVHVASRSDGSPAVQWVLEQIDSGNFEGAIIEGNPPPLSTLVPLSAEELREAVNAERARRVIAGTDVTVDGIGTVPMTGRDADQLAILALKDTARDLKTAGITAALIPFRDRDNTNHLLTADQMIQLADAGKAWVQAVYQASWDIKGMDPLPDDVTDDGLWPAIV